jgi:opacity protein-like surface antigen
MRSMLFLTLVLGANAAQAGDGLFYFGAGVGRDNVTVESGIVYPNIHSASWDTFAGIRPTSGFAIEADYIDLGNQKAFPVPIVLGCGLGGGPCYEASESAARAFAGYAVGFLPIPVPKLDVYGKAGLARFRLSRSFCACGGPPGQNTFYASSDTSTAFTWGAGVQARIGVIGGRLEYEGFNKVSTSVFSFSVFLNL